MKLYILKHNFLYNILGCKEDIPTNDVDAFAIYESKNYLYNKLFIAKSQGIESGTLYDTPNNFPVLIRPIINLHGMGKGAYIVNNISDLRKISDIDFWVEIIKDRHYSVDIFYNSFGILGTLCFEGTPAYQFTFSDWTYLPKYKLPKKIEDWVYKNLDGYCGVFNLEIIGDKIIECHLRMGDLNYFQNEDLLKCLIQTHNNHKVVVPELQQIYLIPVFVQKNKYIKLSSDDIYFFVRFINVYDYILNYFIDPAPDSVANPNGGDRICNFTVSNLFVGRFLRFFILNFYIPFLHKSA